MNKHTPGPWLPHMAFSDPDGVPEFCVDVMKAATREDYKLIAAAPDLLEALEELLKLHDNEVFVKEPWEESMEQARAALAKARGEQ